MATTAEMLSLALAQHRSGNLGQAEQLYREILTAEPSQPYALHYLGVVAAQTGKHDLALDYMQQTLAVAPQVAAFHENLGLVYQALGRRGEALATFQRALVLDPDNATIHYNLGNILKELGQLTEAKESYLQALRRQPDYSQAHNNLAAVLFEEGNLDEAIGHLRQAIGLQPENADAHNNLGAALWECQKHVEAEASYRQALVIRPEYADAHDNLGHALKFRGEVQEAAAHYEQSYRIRPGDHFHATLAILVPPIYQSTGDLLAWRGMVIDRIRRLHEAEIRINITHQAAPPPFYLAYHGLNDRDLMEKITGLYSAPQTMASGGVDPRRRARQDKPGGSQVAGSRIKIGFISRHLRNHTIGELMRGLLVKLPRKDFQIAVLAMGGSDDEVTRFLREHVEHYIRLPANLPVARRIIVEQQFDVLFYPDLGMDSLTYTLAFSRLAPVQCTTWGHPSTTGIGTIDHFLSSALFETEAADEHYSEKLVRLKSLPFYCYRPGPLSSSKDRTYFGLPRDSHLYACPQSLFKFHPEFDVILGGILRRDPHGMLILHHDPCVPKELLWQRFTVTLPDVLDRIRFLPRLDHADYLNLNAIVEVLLDTIHFNGGNTSLKGLALGTPIVTMPTEFLRGRITLALYKKMQVLDCVAHTPAEYVDLAVRLGTDADYRQMIKEKIQNANEVLFDNDEAVSELAEFFRGIG